MSTLKGNKAELAGDGRSDFPGYNVKYGTYIVMDTETRKVFRSTVLNSSYMEKQGLTDSLESIEKNGLVVKALTTERHVHIRHQLSTPISCMACE